MAVIRWVSLRERMILNYVIISMLAIIMVGGFTYYIARKALMERTFQQLTSVKMVKKNQVEGYLTDQIRDVRMLANNNFVNQIAEAGALQIGSKKNTAGFEPGIRFLKEYMENNTYCRNIIIGKQGDSIGIILNRGDNSELGTIDISIVSFPLRTIDSTLKNNNICIIDLIQSADQCLLITCPIQPKINSSPLFIGVSLEASSIDTIMLEHDASRGLGKSGESYLVGEDQLLRSNSRFSSDYFHTKKIKTTGVNNAFDTGDGIGSYKDYRGINVLGSYGMISLPGIRWVILAEIDYGEAIIPIFRLRNNVLILTLLIAFGVFLFTFYISKKITRPLVELKNAVMEIREGHSASVELPSGNDELRDLSESFNQMAMELSIKRNELIVERLQRVRAMIDGQEHERQRLNRELHDGLGQYMAALKMHVQSIIVDDPENSRRKVEEISNQVDQIIEEIRRVTYDLRPALLNEIGLTSAIRNLCSNASRPGSTEFKLTSGELSQGIDQTTQTYVFRIIQEAIHNILKHSNALEAHININTYNNQLLITIVDNGDGFDTSAPTNGSGLPNIHERVNLMSGTIEINSTTGKGSSLRISIPI